MLLLRVFVFCNTCLLLCAGGWCEHRMQHARGSMPWVLHHHHYRGSRRRRRRRVLSDTCDVDYLTTNTRLSWMRWHTAPHLMSSVCLTCNHPQKKTGDTTHNRTLSKPVKRARARLNDAPVGLVRIQRRRRLLSPQRPSNYFGRLGRVVVVWSLHDQQHATRNSHTHISCRSIRDCCSAARLGSLSLVDRARMMRKKRKRLRARAPTNRRRRRRPNRKIRFRYACACLNVF